MPTEAEVAVVGGRLSCAVRLEVVAYVVDCLTSCFMCLSEPSVKWFPPVLCKGFSMSEVYRCPFFSIRYGVEFCVFSSGQWVGCV